jgi:serpin B
MTLDQEGGAPVQAGGTMMKSCKVIPFLVLLAVALACAPSRLTAQANIDSLARDNTASALNLYREIATSPGNLILSPYSISSALAMTYAGARGETERQMARALCFSMGQDALHPAFAALQAGLNAIAASDSLTLSIANSLWPHTGLKLVDTYTGLVKENYGVSVTPVDYETAPEAARQAINRWTAERTQSRIQDLIPEGLLDGLTRLVLVDAVYFLGEWADPFDSTLTKTASFHVAPGESVSTPMMTEQEHLLYADFDSLQVLRLQYQGKSLSMLIMLPRAPYTLEHLETHISPSTLELWESALGRTDVRVFLPKFKMTHEFRLDRALKSLGMVDAFLPDKADFSGMSVAPDALFISAVLHKAFVEVDEKGTEAAAATSVHMTLTSVQEPTGPPPVFRADHPFLFLIQHNRSGSILFIGRVADPTSRPPSAW